MTTPSTSLPTIKTEEGPVQRGPSSRTSWPRQTAEADKTLLVGESISVATDFMQQRHEDAEFETMDAFNRVGTAMDNLMAGLG